MPADKIGVRDSFFELGGHSLSATRVLARLRSMTTAALSPRLVFEVTTVRQQAEALDEAGVSLAPAQPIGRAPAEAAVASFAQERLWYVQQLQPGGVVYNVPLAFRLVGEVDVQALAG
ncbi:phosphopantetheine-binding protein, partial [Melissospora conviva]